MSIALVTALIVIALLALMVLGTPLGVATLLVSVATSLIYFGLPGLFLVSSNVYHVLENYSLVAVPLFVFMAGILERSGIAESLFDAMAETGAAPQSTIMIGDTSYDLEMAQRIDMPAIGVKWGVHPPETLSAFSPIAIVDSASELAQTLHARIATDN